VQSDEQLYELSAKELAESPRQGLLIKCMANSDGDENRGKALYIKTRVEEMKEEIREGLRKQQAEEKEATKKAMKEAEENGEIMSRPEIGMLMLGLGIIVIFTLFIFLRSK
jgi:hypothetical protein